MRPDLRSSPALLSLSSRSVSRATFAAYAAASGVADTPCRITDTVTTTPTIARIAS